MIKYFLSVSFVVMLWSVATSQPTGWDVITSEYEYSMSFTWQIKFASSMAIDEADYMAAYVNDEVRGVVAGLYHPGFQQLFFPMLIYSNSVSGDDMTFMFYDASEDLIYKIDGEYEFVLDQSNGSFSDPKIYVIDDLLPQKISFDELGMMTFGDASFQLVASSSSGLDINYTSANEEVATVIGSTVTIVGAGNTVITAHQAGNTTYHSAEEVIRTLIINQADQIITFESLVDADISQEIVDISATTNSGLEVVFSLLSGPAILSGSTLTLKGTGEVVIAADQQGNANYNPAMQVTQSFSVTDSINQEQSITFSEVPDETYGNVSVYPNPFESYVDIQINSMESKIDISLINLTGKIIFNKQLNYISSTDPVIRIEDEMRGLPNGIYHLILLNGTEKNVFKLVK